MPAWAQADLLSLDQKTKRGICFGPRVGRAKGLRSGVYREERKLQGGRSSTMLKKEKTQELSGGAEGGVRTMQKRVENNINIYLEGEKRGL